MRPVRKSFSIYSPSQAIFFFRWLLLACVVPMSRLQPRPVWNVFVFTFITGLNSCRSEVSRLGPASGMTWDRDLSYFHPGLM
jgi:hypothetical protein